MLSSSFLDTLDDLFCLVEDLMPLGKYSASDVSLGVKNSFSSENTGVGVLFRARPPFFLGGLVDLLIVYPAWAGYSHCTDLARLSPKEKRS